MTSEEILKSLEDHKTEKGWLREIALQLAMLNDIKGKQPDPVERPTLTHDNLGPIVNKEIKRGPGRPPKAHQ